MAIYQKKDKTGKVIKDKKGNSWYYRRYYTDMYGKRKQRKSKLFLTKTIASEEERKFLVEVKNKDTVDNNLLFRAICLEWLSIKQNKVKVTTYYGIEKMVYKHIINSLGNTKILKININALNKWKNDIANTLSIHRANTIITILKEILLYANEFYDFDKRIANTLIKIRDDTPKGEPKSKNNYWTFEEFTEFINIVDNDYYNLVFTFLYRTGLRIGELRALTWKDIDLETKKLYINKSMSKETFQSGSIIVTPKTLNSIRALDLDDKLITRMIEYRHQQTQYYDFNDTWLIFGGIKEIGLTTLRTKLDYYIKIANVKRITIHGFRHSHVSLLINIGCDTKDVAERIGDTIKMVENTYYHMFPEKKKIIIERLNNI